MQQGAAPAQVGAGATHQCPKCETFFRTKDNGDLDFVYPLLRAPCENGGCWTSVEHLARRAPTAALAPPSVPSATDANGVWVPPNLYKAACALDALIHSTPDMSGDLRGVRLIGGPKKLSDAVRAFKWALSVPPATCEAHVWESFPASTVECGNVLPCKAHPSAPPGPNDDRLLLLKALLTGEVEEILFDEEGAPEADLYWQNGERETVKIDSEGFPILTDSLRAALTEATHG